MWFLFWVFVWVGGSYLTKKKLEELVESDNEFMLNHNLKEDEDFIRVASAVWPLLGLLIISGMLVNFVY